MSIDIYYLFMVKPRETGVNSGFSTS